MITAFPLRLFFPAPIHYTFAAMAHSARRPRWPPTKRGACTLLSGSPHKKARQGTIIMALAPRFAVISHADCTFSRPPPAPSLPPSERGFGAPLAVRKAMQRAGPPEACFWGSQDIRGKPLLRALRKLRVDRGGRPAACARFARSARVSLFHPCSFALFFPKFSSREAGSGGGAGARPSWTCFSERKVCEVEIGPFFTRPVRVCRVSVRQAHRGRKSLRRRTKAKKRNNQRTGGKEENEINPWAQCCSWRKGRHALGFPLPSTQFHLSFPSLVTLQRRLALMAEGLFFLPLG